MTEPPTDAAGYAAIARAIDFLVASYQDQPSLAQAAAVAGLSPDHFQRVFSRLAGISPKRFIQYLTLGHAKAVLERSHSVLDAALDAGLSGPSRLHDLFITCEAMTPGEYKAGGAALVIRWGVHPSPFGPVLAAVTGRGLVWLGFVMDERAAAVAHLATSWSRATLIEDAAATRPAVERAFGWSTPTRPLALLLRGTNFQIKVWEALLRIPPGALVSYRDVATAIGQPTAVRAVGGAVGANPITVLIPCHRVILGSGALHNYGWGPERKRALLAWELARADEDHSPSTSAMP